MEWNNDEIKAVLMSLLSGQNTIMETLKVHGQALTELVVKAK